MQNFKFFHKRLMSVRKFHTGVMDNAIVSEKPEEKLIQLNSQKINYLKIGRGSLKLLLCPGALGTIWSDFRPQIEGLDGEKFTLLVWEPPGHGFSRPPDRLLTSKFYEEDADTAHNLTKALNFWPFSWLGWSDGGITGMIYASKYSESIKKLVIWGSNSYLSSKDIENYEKIRDIKKWSEKVSGPLKKLYGEKVLQDIQNSWCDAMLEIEKRGGDICESSLDKIKCPTLILHGDKDPLVGIEHFEHLMAKINGAKGYRFPNGKHNIHLRYAEEFNEVIAKFLLE